MKSSFLPCALLASVPAALAQTQNVTFLAGFLAALNGAGLTALGNIAEPINSTAVGQQLLATLSDGSPFVLFAPSDQAFANAPSNITSDNDILAQVLSYHLVSGNFTGVATTYPNVTLGRTFLNESQFVDLEGGKSQVVAWALRADGKTHVLNQRNDTTVVNVTSYQNIIINAIDNVLDFPESFAETIPTNNNSLSSLQGNLSAIQVSAFDPSTNETTNESFFDLLNESLHGYTFFAPQNSALDSVQSTLSGLNSSAVEDLFLNHLINGSTIYTPSLIGENFTSAGGQTLSFSLNSTGQYVTSGNVTALISQPDVLLTNGVIHIIDRVLFNTEFDGNAASSAIASATSVAAHSTTETQPIGFSQTASLVGPSGSGSSTGSAAGGSGSSNAATRVSGPTSAQMVGVSMTLLGVFAGGLVILL